MDRAEIQQRIDQVDWYHEMDFGDGLSSKSRLAAEHGHRSIWAFIEAGLDRIDFAGKTVLDIGCWDGRWSFYAEKRGARHVLATDDKTQNWSDGEGLLLARELLGSSIEIDQHRSIHALAEMGRTFDIVLCLGVYYHLVDPFHALAQVRHCCHDGSIVVFEGDATAGLAANTEFYDLRHRQSSTYIPTEWGFRQLVEAVYLDVERSDWLRGVPRPPSLRARLKAAWRLARGAEGGPIDRPRRLGRLMTVCRPFAGRANPCHQYRPPFDLHRYDSRFCEGA